MSDRPRRDYEPPTGDAPLDAIEQELVRMWADIIEAKLREELAAETTAANTKRASHLKVARS